MRPPADLNKKKGHFCDEQKKRAKKIRVLNAEPVNIEASKCSHPKGLLVPSSYSAHSVSFNCKKCGERVERSATAQEKKKITAHLKKEYGGISAIHVLFHQFAQEALYQPKPRLITESWVKAAAKTPESSADFKKAMKSLGVTRREWALHKKLQKMTGKKSLNIINFARSKLTAKPRIGYDAMAEASDFARKHPEVKICGVDDDHHASSELVFVPNKTDKRYWGTSVVYIPQLSGEAPVTLFLYPGHLDRLLDTLKELQKEQRRLAKVEKREERAERARRKLSGKQWDWE